jgi:ferredoxin--NADP+ reductase
MMKFCAATTKPFGVPTVVVPQHHHGGRHGYVRRLPGDRRKRREIRLRRRPEFDGHLVDFDGMMRRLGSYKEQEAEHACRLTARAEALGKEKT